MLNSTQTEKELVNNPQEGIIDRADQEVDPQVVDDPFGWVDDAFRERTLRALFTSYNLDDLG